MYRLFQPTSVTGAPVLVIFIDEDQSGWCRQFSEEGYAVVQVARPRDTKSGQDSNTAALQTFKVIRELGSRSSWAIITYGVTQDDAAFISTFLDVFCPAPNLKACIHFTISCRSPAAEIPRNSAGQVLHTMVHLSSSQEETHAVFQLLADAELSQLRSTSEYPPISVYTYSRVPFEPPFPYKSKAPALVQAGESSSVDPYIRSATNLSYSRTLALLRRELGPHFDLERLWERHIHYEFVEGDAHKTMSTMVKVPYVNHVATLTGGVGHDDLARFYKYHFTGTNVTPPDTELIVISRTVGADRIIDEMIFKATHTTEIDYFLPGIKPTGKPFQVALVGVIAFRGDKLTFEHIYWDQVSLLVQLGLLDPLDLPVAGVETAQKVLDPFAVPSNMLMKRWKVSEGLSVD